MRNQLTLSEFNETAQGRPSAAGRKQRNMLFFHTETDDDKNFDNEISTFLALIFADDTWLVTFSANLAPLVDLLHFRGDDHRVDCFWTF